MAIAASAWGGAAMANRRVFRQEHFRQEPAADNGEELGRKIIERIRQDLDGEPIGLYEVNLQGDPTHILANGRHYFFSQAGHESKNGDRPITPALADVWNYLSAENQTHLAAIHPELTTLPRHTAIDGQPPPIDIDTLPDIESIQAPKITWMIEGLIIDGTLNIIAGDPAGGKTYLAAAIAGAVAHGKPFCGFPVTQAPALYDDREGQRLGLFQKRLPQLGLKTGPNLKVWGNWISHEPPLPSSPSLIAWARKHRRCLIVLDSQIAFMDGRDENDAGAMRGFYNGCRALTKEGATLIILHHTGRSDDSRYRGSSDILAAADALYFAKKTNKGLKLERLTLTVVKSRELVIQELNLRLDDDGRGWSLDSSKRTDNVDDHGTAKLTELLRQNPGITLDRFGKLAVKKKIAGRDPAIAFLKQGVKDGTISQTTGRNNSRLHTLLEDSD